MADSHESHLTKPAKLVTFGSLITLNLEDNFSYYVYGEGFNDTKVKL